MISLIYREKEPFRIMRYIVNLIYEGVFYGLYEETDIQFFGR